MQRETKDVDLGGSLLGVITFLFTDIEGSTRRWEADPATMRAVMERHDLLLTEAIETNGGRVVLERGEGDSFFAVFERPAAAVSAALDSQRALVAERWPDSTPVKVRMAIHTGEADAQIRGPEVNRAARIRAVAHGGQVVVSSVSESLTQGSLPPGASLLDLGEYRLKDLSRPERVYQLVHPQLPAQFPPLKSLDAFSHNLPIQVTSFIGRELEIADLTKALEGSRMVTLTGTGGTGKTRLALQVVGSLVDSFAEGVYFVDLAPVSDPGLVTQAVASALSVREASDTNLVEQVIEKLGRGRQLLLMDNCEHLIDAAARLSSDLLARCPQLTILATSREALNIAGESVWRVPSLSLPEEQRQDLEEVGRSEAVRLFVERAGAAKRDFVLSDANRDAVAHICRRLDGVPLAIELAAARTSSLTPEEIMQRLADRFRLLTGGSRTAMARQQTLEAAVDWSHDLLTPAEQVLFRRLSVFSGGFDISAAESVGAGEQVDKADILDLLARLVDRSLVVADDSREGGTRFRLLETLRQYGRKKLLDSGEAELFQRRHFEHYLEFAETALRERRHDQNLWLDRLEVELNNFRVALEWAVRSDGDLELRLAGGVGWLWAIRGPYREGRDRMIEILGRRVEGSASRARVLGHAAALSLYRGDKATAVRFAEESTDISRELGDESGFSESISRLGFAEWSAGELDSAQKHFEQASEIWRQQGRPRRLAYTTQMLADIAASKGDMRAARELVDESVALARSKDDNRSLMLATNTDGRISLFEGDVDRAARRFAESLRLARNHGDQAFMTVGLAGSMAAAAATGDLVRAARLEGAVDFHRQSIGFELKPPWAESLQEEWSAVITRSLPGADARREEGRRLTLDQAVALALGEEA
jgi:predicted ATPase/class 3 adenylate cyclase